jgi:hypothetical protein
MKRFAMLTVAVAFMLSAPASALAASSTCQAYNPQTCNVIPTSQTRPATSDGSLPFTGLDVVLLVAGGGALLGAGFVVRRLSRRLN